MAATSSSMSPRRRRRRRGPDMDLNVIDDKGRKTATVAGSDALFGHDYNEPLIHQVVTAYQANARSGTRAQKGRSDVNKSHRKPWNQKGTGRVALQAGDGLGDLGVDPRGCKTEVAKT